MPYRRKPKKKPLEEFNSMIVPDRIEEAFERVETYFTDHHHLSFDTSAGVSGVLDELIHQNGEPVRKALYTLLCDPESSLRKVAGDSLLTGGVKSTVGVLVPLLVAQFALAPAVALLVAALVIKTVAAGGEKTVCEELAQQHRKSARGIRNALKKKAEIAARATSRKTHTAPAGNKPYPHPAPARTKTSRRMPAPGTKAPTKDTK